MTKTPKVCSDPDHKENYPLPGWVWCKTCLRVAEANRKASQQAARDYLAEPFKRARNL